MVISAAGGSYVWDGDGNKYLDFSSQLVNTNIGHQHPAVVSAIAAQATKLCTIAPSYVNDARSEAARLIAERTPGELDKIFFTNGGADANEHAIRMARLHTGRQKVLSAYRSYHGGTQLAINVTGDPRRWASDTASTGTVHFFPPYLYRTAFHSTTEEEESQRALEHLEQLISFEGPSTIAALILESIPGTAGIYMPPPGYLQGVRELCTTARHRLHRRRSHVRLRPHRNLVRRRTLRRRPGPADLRQGRELRLCPDGRRGHQPGDRSRRSASVSTPAA